MKKKVRSLFIHLYNISSFFRGQQEAPRSIIPKKSDRLSPGVLSAGGNKQQTKETVNATSGYLSEWVHPPVQICEKGIEPF